MKDLYKQMRQEVKVLWNLLRGSQPYLLSGNVRQIQDRLLKVHRLGVQIGGQVHLDAEQLKSDVERFVGGELTPAEINLMMQHALKLEEDTREL